MKPVSTLTDAELLLPKHDYSIAFEQAPIPLALLGPDLTILDANLLFRELLAHSQEQVLGLRITELLRSNRREAIEDVLHQVERNGSFSLEAEALNCDGIRVPLIVDLKAIATPGGSRFVACLREITCSNDGLEPEVGGARPSPSEVLNSGEAGRLASLSRSLSTERNKDAVIASICSAAREMAQADGACLILREGELVHYAQEDTVAHLWAGQRFPINNCISGWSILNRRPVVIEDIYSDERIPVEYYRSTFVKSLAMMPIENENPIGAIGLYWANRYRPTKQQLSGLERLADIAGLALLNIQLIEELSSEVTERLRAEEQVRRQAALLDEATDAILVCDLEARIAFWSKGAERTYGWTAEEALGRQAQDLHRKRSDHTYSQAGQALLEAGYWSGEVRHASKDGKELIVQSRWTLLRDRDGNPEAILIINADVTGEKRREAEFLRAQRMESLGTLAGGIAHDINNVLSPILMAIRLLETSPPGEGTRRVLDVLQTNVERGANMVRQILEFARGVEGERIVLQPEHLIKQIIYVLGETLSKSIKIRFSALDKLWTIRADPTQIHQVLMNLLVNARDAMPGGGEITIEANNVSIDENYSRMMPDATPGRYVRIGVRDTGTGIPRDKIERVFEPFFTTKEHGKGTGLGLSTALAIVKSHGGFIGVYSEEKKGTEFKIYLPAVDITAAVQSAGEKAELPIGQGELVLVADDESAVREITKSTLEAYGYRVLVAGDGTEAVAVFAEHKDEIRLVLIDTMMPYMDGPAAIRAMRRLNPEIRVILNSGMGANSDAIEDVRVSGFLAKPYTADQLLNALAGALRELG